MYYNVVYMMDVLWFKPIFSMPKFRKCLFLHCLPIFFIYWFWMITMTNQFNFIFWSNWSWQSHSSQILWTCAHCTSLIPSFFLVRSFILWKLAKSSLLILMNHKYLPSPHSGRSSQVSTSVESSHIGPCPKMVRRCKFRTWKNWGCVQTQDLVLDTSRCTGTTLPSSARLPHLRWYQNLTEGNY